MGIDTTSFLMVRTCVTSSAVLTTSPSDSPIRTRSPILNALVYVRIAPAITFEIAELDDSETSRPRKIDTPWNAGDFDPGI